MLWCPTALSLPQLADFLQECQFHRKKTAPFNPKQAMLCGWHALRRSFLIHALPRSVRKPCPLCLPWSLESKNHSSRLPRNARHTLGGVLLAAHRSLRFKDLQRNIVLVIVFVPPSTARHVLATKTTSQGQPSPPAFWPALLEQAQLRTLRQTSCCHAFHSALAWPPSQKHCGLLNLGKQYPFLLQQRDRALSQHSATSVLDSDEEAAAVLA